MPKQRGTFKNAIITIPVLMALQTPYQGDLEPLRKSGEVEAVTPKRLDAPRFPSMLVLMIEILHDITCIYIHTKTLGIMATKRMLGHAGFLSSTV